MNTTLRQRIGLLFAAFFLLVTVSAAAAWWVVNALGDDARVINLAGRQRMLVQQITHDALAMQRGEDSAAADSLRAAAHQFDRTLAALTDGGAAPYLTGHSLLLPRTRESNIRAELAQVRRTWDALRPALAALLAAPPGTPALDAAVEDVLRAAPGLVQQSDHVVRLYESASEQRVNRLRWLQISFFSGALGLLLAGTWTLRVSILRPLRALDAAAEQIGQGNLETPLVVQGPREVAALAGCLDEMRVQLKASHEELESRIQQRTQELAALYEISHDISSRLEINHVLRSVTDKTRGLLSSDIAFLCLLDEAEQRLDLQAGSGPPAAACATCVSRRSCPAVTVLERDSALVCGAAEGCGIVAPAFRASHLVAPLRVGERVIGALCVGSARPQAFAEDEAHLLTKLANSAAVALENARLYQQAERVATLEERQRIAADMHDGLAQTLSYLRLKTEHMLALLERGSSPEAIAELQCIHEVIGQANQDVRRSIASLQDAPRPERSLCERVRETLETFAATSGLRVEWRPQGDEPACATAGEDEQVLRVVSEALQNIQRHAHARQVTVTAQSCAADYRIMVEDDGQGFDAAHLPADGRGHFGLGIMRARAARLGGQVTFESAPGRGTRVILSWPRSPAAPEESARS